MKLSALLNPANWFFPESRRYQLEVLADENEIQKIKDFAQAICVAANYASADCNVVKLVLEEVCVNIMRHAYLSHSEGKIQLEISIGWPGLRIKVTDQGQSFDFDGVKDPDLQHYVDIGKRGGLGIWFIRKMMTRVRYRSYLGYNEWNLFYRPAGSALSLSSGKPGFDNLSLEFILASFVLFSFLLFLVYVLCCLVAVPAVGLEDSVVRRIQEGSRTNLGRGILLVYVMGLAGFYLIFSKLFKPFREDAKRMAAFKSSKTGASPARNQGEYERLLGLMSELEEKLRENESKLEDQARLQLELRITESTRQEELRTFENTRKMETQIVQDATQKAENAQHETAQAVENAQREAARIVEEAQSKAAKEVEELHILTERAAEKTHQELEHLSQVRNELDQQLQEARRKIIEQENVQAGMQKEVKVAQQIQHALLPKEFPQIEGFQIGASYRAAQEVGGDYYDFIWVNPTTLGIAVGDVAGKGVPGSMVMAMIRTAMRLEARNNKSPASVLLKVHQHVNGDMKRGMFATMFYIVLDSINRSISFASAGHNPMILYRKSTDEVYFLKPKGFPLGIDLPDENLFAKTLAVQKLSLQKDDVLVIYTDGVTEAMNNAKEQFGETRLIQAIRDNAHRTPEELVQKLEQDIAAFIAGAEQSDDVTIVAIKENLQAEDVIYKFRRDLLNLVDNDGLSIAEACRRMNVSPQTYYHYKAIYSKKGKAGLKPVLPKKRNVMKELSVDQKSAVLSVVKLKPELGPAAIVDRLKKDPRMPLKLNTKVVTEFLSRKGLSEAKERKVFAANEIDTI
jgi:serine phosphatase RsbU (regulator of sigma subunit)/anti-sigma regulatory factor (Ser/Thr protein kinase)/transposase